MTTTFDPQSIANIAYQGLGIGIIAGVSMKTLDIMQEGLGQKKGRRKKQKQWQPPKMVFQELKLKTPKW